MRNLKTMWKKTASVCAALGAAWTLATPRTAEACGGNFCDPGPLSAPVNQDSEDVVFVLKPGEVEVHIQISIDPNTSAPKFAWVIPIQEVPEFEVGSQPLFDALRNASVPQYGLNTTQEVCGDGGLSGGGGISTGAPNDSGEGGTSGASGGDPEPDPVLLKTQAGAFEIVVLQDKTVAPIKQWLLDNEYLWPEGMGVDELIQTYLDEGNVIAALKLTTGADAGDVHPIVLRFPSNETCFPLRLTRISSVEDMDIRVFVLANDRAAPTNYRHVLVNPLKIDWLNFASNYKEVIRNAVDELMADGLAFVTEYAGPTDVVDPFAGNVYNIQWDETQFAGLPADQVISVLNQQGLMTCDDIFFCQFNHPLIRGLLDEWLPVPNGLTPEEFYSNLPNYAGMIDVMLWGDGSGFAKGLLDRIIAPGMRAQELLDTYPYLTRMYTVISPNEMVADPIFHVNPDLDDVANQRIADRFRLCDGNSVVTLPDGREIFVPNDGPWPQIPGEMWWSEEISQIALKGKPMHLVNNTAAINKKIEEWNLSHGWPRFPAETSGSSGSGDDSASTGPDQQGEGGCGCSSDKEPGSAGLLGLVGLGLLAAGRRRRR